MAETKKENKLEREYVIPLRRAWINVPAYERTGKAIKAIKKFVAKHMKVVDRNVKNVKLDVYLNNELWFRGRANPPSRVKVKVIKEGDIVQVKFAETPQHVNFLKLKNAKFHKKVEDKKPVAPKAAEAKAEEKTVEQKTDEKEKEKAGELQSIKQAEQQVKAEKHTTKVKEQKINRMALKK